MAATQTGQGRTPAGTDFRTFMDTVPGAGTVRWIVPESLIGETGIPGMCLYTHGAGGGSDEFVSLGAWAGIRNHMIDSGVVTIEGTGGGTQPWAADVSKTAYEATWQYGVDLFAPQVTFGLFRSMGGLVGEWLLTKSPVVAPSMAGAMVNSGVQDLMWAYRFDRWTAAMNAAWGVSSYAEFQVAAQASDPMQFDPSLWDGKKMLQLVGTADPLVPMNENGIAIRNRYAGHPAVDLLDIRQGGDHSTSNGSYLQTAAMARFVDEMLGKEPEPIPTGVIREVISASRMINGEWRLILGRG